MEVVQAAGLDTVYSQSHDPQHRLQTRCRMHSLLRARHVGSGTCTPQPHPFHFAVSSVLISLVPRPLSERGLDTRLMECNATLGQGIRACTNTVTVHVGRFTRLKPPEGNPVCTVTTQGYCSLCGDASVIAVEGALLVIG